MVSGTVSLPCSGCFSPFLHSTGSLSVSREYLALPDGPGRFTQDSSCPALLRIPLRLDMLRIHNYHVLWSHFPERSSHISSSDVAVLQPHTCRNMGGLGSSPFARHYWGNHCYFLFLRVLRCFSSPRSPPSMMDDRPSACRVVPFGNLRIRGHLHLPGAYRSLSRPSSPPRAKASAMCPYLISSSPPLNVQGEEYTFSCKSICIAAEDPLDLSFTFACYNMSNISSKHYACLLCGE